MEKNENFCRIKYDPKEKEYSLQITQNTGETWRIIEKSKLEKGEYIHYRIIEELIVAVSCGFKFVL